MSRSHRGTRSRHALGGTVGTRTWLDRALNVGWSLHIEQTYGTSSWLSRRTFKHQGARIRNARKWGIVFSSFPGYVKATDLKTGTVSFGRDTYSALEAQWAAQQARGIDGKVIRLQRAEIFRQAGRHNA